MSKVFFALLSLFSLCAFAQEDIFSKEAKMTPTEIKAQEFIYQKYKEFSKSTDHSIRRLTAEMEKVDEALKSSDQRIKKAAQDFDSEIVKALKEKTVPGRPAKWEQVVSDRNKVFKDIEALKVKKEQLKAQINEEAEKLTKFASQAYKVAQKIEDEAPKKIAALEAAVGTLKLDSKFSEIEFDAERLDLALRFLEDKFDNTVMAVYMREKMTKLLQSEQLCKAVSKCEAGGSTASNNGVPKGALEDLFSEASENSKRPSQRSSGQQYQSQPSAGVE